MRALAAQRDRIALARTVHYQWKSPLPGPRWTWMQEVEPSLPSVGLLLLVAWTSEGQACSGGQECLRAPTAKAGGGTPGVPKGREVQDPNEALLHLETLRL